MLKNSAVKKLSASLPGLRVRSTICMQHNANTVVGACRHKSCDQSQEVLSLHRPHHTAVWQVDPQGDPLLLLRAHICQVVKRSLNPWEQRWKDRLRLLDGPNLHSFIGKFVHCIPRFGVPHNVQGKEVWFHWFSFKMISHEVLTVTVTDYVIWFGPRCIFSSFARMSFRFFASSLEVLQWHLGNTINYLGSEWVDPFSCQEEGLRYSLHH